MLLDVFTGVDIVDGVERDVAVGAGVPHLKSDIVAMRSGVVDLLEDVKVGVVAVAVFFFGVVGVDDSVGVVVDENLSVFVDEGEVVVGSRKDGTSGETPASVGVGEPGKFVESGERSQALHVLEVCAVGNIGGRSSEVDQAAQTSRGA